jgi:4a-hydroxytetrahydrobiopterin dehydratase
MKTKLTPSEIEDVLRTHPKWKLKEGKLVSEWTFHDFPEAIAFVNRIAALAEDANHHPDIDIRYNRVLLALVSHDAGGITQRDASMAARISAEPSDATSPTPQ